MDVIIFRRTKDLDIIRNLPMAAVRYAVESAPNYRGIMTIGLVSFEVGFVFIATAD